MQWWKWCWFYGDYDNNCSYSDDYENNDKDYNGNDNSHNDDGQTLIAHITIHWFMDGF